MDLNDSDLSEFDLEFESASEFDDTIIPQPQEDMDYSLSLTPNQIASILFSTATSADPNRLPTLLDDDMLLYLENDSNNAGLKRKRNKKEISSEARRGQAILQNRPTDECNIPSRIPTISHALVFNKMPRRGRTIDHDGNNNESSIGSARVQRKQIMNKLLDNLKKEHDTIDALHAIQVDFEGSTPKDESSLECDNSLEITSLIENENEFTPNNNSDDNIIQHARRSLILKQILLKLKKDRKLFNNSENVQKQIDADTHELFLLAKSAADTNKNLEDAKLQTKLSRDEKLAKLQQSRLNDRKMGLIEWRLIVQGVVKEIMPIEKLVYDLHIVPNIINSNKRSLKSESDIITIEDSENNIDHGDVRTGSKTRAITKRDQITNTNLKDDLNLTTDLFIDITHRNDESLSDYDDNKGSDIEFISQQTHKRQKNNPATKTPAKRTTRQGTRGKK